MAHGVRIGPSLGGDGSLGILWGRGGIGQQRGEDSSAVTALMKRSPFSRKIGESVLGEGKGWGKWGKEKKVYGLLRSVSLGGQRHGRRRKWNFARQTVTSLPLSPSPSPPPSIPYSVAMDHSRRYDLSQ